jgi:hypothetical protein
MDNQNEDTEVMINGGRIIPLRALMPTKSKE